MARGGVHRVPGGVRGARARRSGVVVGGCRFGFLALPSHARTPPPTPDHAPRAHAVGDQLLEPENLVSLEGGCVCCSLRKDVVK